MLRRSLRDYIALFLAALAAFLAATGALSTRRVEDLNEAAKRMDRIEGVIVNLKDTLASMERAVASQRGFVLVGKQPLLVPFDQALVESKGYINELLVETRDDPVEQRELTNLQTLIQKKVDFLKAGIVSRRRQGLAAAARLAALQEDQRLTEEINRTVKAMEIKQSQRLYQVRQESSDTSERTGKMVSMLSLFNFALVFVIYYLVNHDFRQRRKHEAELRELATTDELTGLHNRRGFVERLDEEIRRARRHNRSVSLLLMDVDNFKSYNDSYGHQPGDQVLQQLAALIQDVGRSTDFAARYGGEELVLLSPETQQDDSMLLAERIRSAVESTRFPHRNITISIGIATIYPAESLTPNLLAERIIADADRALYYAKATGRNRVAHVADVGEWRNVV